MNREETMKIMEILSIAYPQFYRNNTPDQMKKAVILWNEMFADDPFQVVAAAVKALIATKANSFPPSIGEVKEQMFSLTSTELNEGSAWALVLKACSNGIYHYQEEFDNLPEEVQAAVGSAAQIHEWSMIDSATLQSVIASNFMRSYKAHLSRKKANTMLPGDIRQMISGVSDMLRLKGKE